MSDELSREMKRELMDAELEAMDAVIEHHRQENEFIRVLFESMDQDQLKRFALALKEELEKE